MVDIGAKVQHTFRILIESAGTAQKARLLSREGSDRQTVDFEDNKNY